MSVEITSAVILFSFILLIFLSYRGMGQVFAPILCAGIVALVSQSGFANALFNIFPSGAALFLQRIMMSAISGTLFGEFFAASGAAKSIGGKVTKIFGINNGPYIIMITTLIVSLSGMPLSLFFMAAFSLALMRASDLPPYIAMVAFVGIDEITAFCMPVPHPINLIPTVYLGTDIYAGLVPGIVASVVGYSLVFLFVHYLVKDARKKKIGYFQIFSFNGDSEDDDIEKELPKFWISIIPLITVVVVTFILQKIIGWNSIASVFIAQMLAILILVTSLKRYYTKSKLKLLEHTIISSGSFLLGCSCMVGYASVVADTTVFVSLQNYLTALNINPYVLTFIGVALFSAITGEANSGMIFYLQTFAQRFLGNSSVNLGAIHRITTITSAGFDSLPNSGMTLLNMRVFGLDHKTGYKYLFCSSIIIPMICALCALAVSLILY